MYIEIILDHLSTFTLINWHFLQAKTKKTTDSFVPGNDTKERCILLVVNSKILI